MNKSKQENVVLFVDDEHEILEIVKDIFRNNSFKVICTDSGQGALNYSKKHDIKLIVCDLILNGISGLDVLTYYKQNCPNTYRILTTGYLDEQKESYCKKAGIFQKLIPKPWDIHNMRNQIGTIVS